MNQIPLSIFDLSIFLVYQISLLLIRLHYIYIYICTIIYQISLLLIIFYCLIIVKYVSTASLLSNTIHKSIT